jgi:PAP2 superfamily protein
MHSSAFNGLVIAAAISLAPPAAANVITDWDAKAVVAVTPMASLGGTSPYMAQRMMAMVHAAMFDAVNSIERRYRPYLIQLPAESTTSKEAAAASAAAAVLAIIDEKTAGEMKTALANYLAAFPDGAAKSDGIKLGGSIAASIIAARIHDGSDGPDAYRPRTSPGIYIPTTITISSMWPDMTPFAIASPSQFRPRPPVSLESKEWATDYNEIKDYGGQSSAKRSAQQTEVARFWLVGPPVAYHPFIRELIIAKQMNVLDSARFMALIAVGLNDAIMAVLDAKYHYNFWRPITAIRNGDIDGNPATDREATWQPIAITPMHPEYPCSHCSQSGAIAAIVKAVFGTADVPEIAMTSPTAPGVVRRWTNMAVFADEVADARIWAGFHYRFSARVGTEMGYQVGDYVAKNILQPVATASR